MSGTPIFHEIMRAEMRPDVYAGPNCDQHAAQWRCSAEGDKGDNCDQPEVSLASSTFPAGTTISVSVPVCPICSTPADHALPAKGIDYGVCPCGFDWVKWTEGRYS